MHDIKNLESRIKSVKKFLNAEITSKKAEGTAAVFIQNDVQYHLDTIHEVERRGVRNLNDVDFIKIQRVLTSIEARMKLHKN